MIVDDQQDRLGVERIRKPALQRASELRRIGLYGLAPLRLLGGLDLRVQRAENLVEDRERVIALEDHDRPMLRHPALNPRGEARLAERAHAVDQDAALRIPTRPQHELNFAPPANEFGRAGDRHPTPGVEKRPGDAPRGGPSHRHARRAQRPAALGPM